MYRVKSHIIFSATALAFCFVFFFSEKVQAQSFGHENIGEISPSNAQPNGLEYGSTVKAVSVKGRSRPEYDAIGGRYRSFFLYPYLSTGIIFDDNIYSGSSRQNDKKLRTTAGLKARSDWSRHFLELVIDIEDFRHQEYQSEDHTNIGVTTQGRVDLYHDLRWYSQFSASHAHEPREESNAPSADIAARPVSYVSVKLSSYIEKETGWGVLQLNGGVEHFDYKDVSTVTGGTFEQDNRDGTIYKLGVRKSILFSPGYNAFATIDGNLRDFKSGAGFIEKDSMGLEVRAGIEFEVTRLIAAEISAGYLLQDFKHEILKDVEDLALKAELVWNPTRLMTVNMELQRIISETTVNQASSHVDTVFSAKIDYEILRNVIGSINKEYKLEDYQGISRKDETISAGLKIEYLLDRNVSIDGYYSYTNRNSTTDSFDYEKSILGANVRVKF